MAVRVALHRFESDPGLRQRDGVNLAHSEINRLLGEDAGAGFEIAFHDFDHLLRDREHARRVLESADCVLCNVGPHAHYYHYLREKLGLGFRIVRDIKTALWSGYLLQESLCEPYLRPGDALLATSHYSRVLTRRLFPHLAASPVHLFEPVLASRRERAAVPPRHRAGKQVTLGYLGRLSEDKNFPQVVDLLIELDREEPGRYRLEAVGAIHSASCDPALVADRIRAETGRNDLFRWRPPVEHDEVAQVLADFDWFLFFSTSNLEVLGRVLIEAGHSHLPILAADHAAAPELVAPSSLLEVTYRRGHAFNSHFDAPLGTVDILEAANIIRSGAFPAAPPEPVVNRPDTLLQVLRDAGAGTDDGSDPLAPAQQRWVDELQWGGLPRWRRAVDAGETIEVLLDWFQALNGKHAPDFRARLAELERLSRFPERTRRFIAGTEATRCDFTNLGGIDIELCNIAGYFPSFSLPAQPAPEPLVTVASDQAFRAA
jgi:glycosyltransferase involved in cell wall biosynthesis